MATHFPDADGWERREPAAAGLDPEGVRAAVEHAKVHDTPHEAVNYDFGNHDPWEGDPPEHAGAIGPMPDRRGGQNGIVLREGRIVAEWGDTRRVDHCFSVAKSFLSIVAGLAWDRGLIDDVDDRVAGYVDDGGFDSDHNRNITWRHLLQGTSEWEGTLFGKPDAVDRNRPVGRDPGGERGTRELREPGTYWEYNDVRINRLALALLRVWGKPLPRVLAHEVMDPIDATRTWEWHGYYNSDVDVDGTRMKSVSGGGHWGGGVWTSTRDLARVGLLLLAGGRWNGTRLLPAEWLDMATAPCDVEPTYGFLFWLNTGRELWPHAPESSYAAIGHGTNTVWVDPEHDLVAVLRWIDDDRGEGDRPGTDGVYERLLDAIE